MQEYPLQWQRACFVYKKSHFLAFPVTEAQEAGLEKGELLPVRPDRPRGLTPHKAVSMGWLISHVGHGVLMLFIPLEPFSDSSPEMRKPENPKL